MKKKFTCEGLDEKDITRFWSKIRKEEEGEKCWIWTTGVNSAGKGAFFALIQGKRVLFVAHRLAWDLERGVMEDPNGLKRICKNTLCCKPDHHEKISDRIQRSKNDPRLRSELVEFMRRNDLSRQEIRALCCVV